MKAPDALEHSPAWFVQDPAHPGNPLMEVRLLQVDVAVKDDHLSSTTGWAFATYGYDESLFPSEPNAWRRLTPIGIQWGNDPGVTGTMLTALNETWINSSMPAAFKDHLGRAGRLIGPVDNPKSSCLSCHSTAEVDMSKKGTANAFVGVMMVPPDVCSDKMSWFRNLKSDPGGSQAFGRAVSSCPVDISTAGLTSLDYSLQLRVGLQSVFGYQNANPCFDFAKQYHDNLDEPTILTTIAQRTDKPPMRVQPAQNRRVKMNLRKGRLIGPTPDEFHRR
ncbi:MAG TPA: hypothetical protein VH394_10445 [Thermoanaerobaculia bacterium]|jgi:hypothetical protein|nr:hypothetical protein [Thermoanaerobaculia bacterium]